MASEPRVSKRAIALVAPMVAPDTQAKSFVEDGATQARNTMETGMEQVTKTAEGFFKAAEEAAEFGRGNIEAVT